LGLSGKNDDLVFVFPESYQTYRGEIKIIVLAAAKTNLARLLQY
jgi:hypothetical protein